MPFKIVHGILLIVILFAIMQLPSYKNKQYAKINNSNQSSAIQEKVKNVVLSYYSIIGIIITIIYAFSNFLSIESTITLKNGVTILFLILMLRYPIELITIHLYTNKEANPD